MIVYNSRTWGTFWQIKGSILPRGSLFAFPPAVLALCLRSAVDAGWIEDVDITGDASIYSGFTFVLGFILVFRTQQSYGRYWLAATSIHEMRSEWYDGCASLIAFAKVSDKTQLEILHFQHFIVRLFSLMNAVALTEIATLSEQNFPLVDIDGLSKESLAYLCSPFAHGRKTEIVFQWVKLEICRANKRGLMGVPPPILTRTFQELGAGLTKYHDAVQIVIWPFPYPYAQLCVGMINLHMLLTPILFVKVAANPLAASLLTFIAILSLKGLDVIAEELENPFGSDANDLPCLAMHRDMNADLISLLDERTWTPPQMMPDAVTDVMVLYAQSKRDNEGISASDIDTAGWSSSGITCHKKSKHHAGSDHDADLDGPAIDLFHLRSYIESINYQLPEVAKTADLKAFCDGVKPPVAEKVVAAPAAPKEPAFDWRNFMQIQHEQTLAAQSLQHEQTLAAQDAFWGKLELTLGQCLPGRPCIPGTGTLAVYPTKMNSGRYHVPQQPCVDPGTDVLTAVLNNGSNPGPVRSPMLN